jgi:hypothetical protein
MGLLEVFIMTHICPVCGKEKTLEDFPLTKEKYYRIVDPSTGERRKLNRCKACVKEYNRERKRLQREREAQAIAEAQAAGSETVLVPIQPAAPASKLEGSYIVEIDGKKYRKLD